MSNGYKPKATMGPSGGLTRYQKQQKGKQGQSSVRLQGQSERSSGNRREVPTRIFTVLYLTIRVVDTYGYACEPFHLPFMLCDSCLFSLLVCVSSPIKDP
jgi:hypothetical protein